MKNMALFCDFENLALGVRDAKYAQFDMKKVLERRRLKGSIIVDRGRKGLSPSPPSEPCWRFSRTRLSSRWFPHRDWLACT